MYALAGLTIELEGPESGSALWTRLAPFERAGRGEHLLRLCACEDDAPGQRLSVQRCGSEHACSGDGLNGRVGEREAELCASGGDAALVAALRLACALWLVARGGLLLHGACVERAGEGHVFIGPSGAGKTTLAARLAAAPGAAAQAPARTRARVVNDEVSCVRGGRLFGQPFQSKLGDGLAPDEGLPLRAISSLSQARDPLRVQLPRARAAHVLLQRVFLPAKDALTLQRALAAAARVVEAVPLFALALPLDDRAVAAALPGADDRAAAALSGADDRAAVAPGAAP